MKFPWKQTAIRILCLLILAIPTCIAIVYYCAKNYAASERYTVIIHTAEGETIDVAEDEIGTVVAAVKKMNKKMKPAMTGRIDVNALPGEYYDISVFEKDNPISSYRYYFSVFNDEWTLVEDITANRFYYLAAKDVRNFLSKKCAYMFYSSATPAALTIAGGEDVIPKRAEWRYKAANGSYVDSSKVKTEPTQLGYAMNGHTKLSFTVPPDKCTVKAYRNGELIYNQSDFASFPYNLLDTETILFKIRAEWNTSAEARGFAEYEFTTYVGRTPEFLIEERTVQQGEFFVAAAYHVSAPQKVEFSSAPDIGITPVFFEEAGTAYALIPMQMDLLPGTYVFSFRYGDTAVSIPVTLESRAVYERVYDAGSVSTAYSEQAVEEYRRLLHELGRKNESVRYFNSAFLDYTAMPGSASDATLILGFGHRRAPNDATAPFRMDGVDYRMEKNSEVVAVCAGKAVYVGYNDFLGHFAVIDHGFGLKTWYCHLSSISIAAGAVVKQGQTVGISGASGYTNANGALLITTILNVPVSPYPLQESGVNLVKRSA